MSYIPRGADEALGATETAHLANDGFRDLDGLGSFDVRDAWMHLHVVAAAAQRLTTTIMFMRSGCSVQVKW